LVIFSALREKEGRYISLRRIEDEEALSPSPTRREPSLIRDKRSVPHRDKGPVPHRDKRPVPHRDKRTVPHRDKRPVTHRDKRPVPHSDKRNVPHRDKGPVPHREKRTVPHRDKKTVPHRTRTECQIFSFFAKNDFSHSDDGGKDDEGRFESPTLKIGLSVEGGGEGHVIKGTLYCVHSGVGLHSLDTVLGLVGGQLSPQLLGQDVRLVSC